VSDGAQNTRHLKCKENTIRIKRLQTFSPQKAGKIIQDKDYGGSLSLKNFKLISIPKVLKQVKIGKGIRA